MRLVALAGEAGGRWSETTAWLLRRLAQAKAAAEPLAQRLATGRALEAQWWALLAVAAQDALASTLLGDAPTFSTAPLPQRADLLLDSGEAPAPNRLPPRKLAHRWAVAGPRASTPEREASELKYNWLRPH